MPSLQRGHDYSRELSHGEVTRDVRTLGEHVINTLANQEYSTIIIVAMAGVMYIMPAMVDLVFIAALGTAFAAWRARVNEGLPFSAPKSSYVIDPNNIGPGGRKPKEANGIAYLGNEQRTGKEIWLSDTQLRTHLLCMGTTGSGKSVMLQSLVFNSLVQDSGFIYIDGKADSGLYANIFSMARKLGREDDLYVINFQTGAKDILGAQATKMSNTLNPFAFGSSGMLSQLVVGLMQQEEGKGGDVWENRAISFVEGLMRPLVFMRDRFGIPLDVDTIRGYFTLGKIEDLVFNLPHKLSRSSQEKNEFLGALSGLRAYLDNLPGYDEKLYGTKQGQSPDTQLQHGYITMQLIRTFNSLADIYGYIMKTPLPEIDLRDVFLNRRILVVLLPALEKAPQELTALGRIIVASLKATMAVGLGSEIEGDYSRVIDSKPTTSNTPFVCVLDEYGYYAVKGFAVVPAQARSLGFSACFAGQDLPAFEKASKEEAKSTIGNTTTQLCGKLQCTETFEFFNKLAGQGFFSRAGGFERDASGVVESHNAINTSSVEKMDRISLNELKALESGEWYMFRDDQIVRINGFYANPEKKGVSAEYLRTNHMIRVARPSMDEIASMRLMLERTKNLVGREFAGVPSDYDNFSETAPGAIVDTIKAFTGGHAPILEDGPPPVLGVAINAILAHYEQFSVADSLDIIKRAGLDDEIESFNAGSAIFQGIEPESIDDYVEECADAVFNGQHSETTMHRENLLSNDHPECDVFEEPIDMGDPENFDDGITKEIETFNSATANDPEPKFEDPIQDEQLLPESEASQTKKRRSRRQRALLDKDTTFGSLAMIEQLMADSETVNDSALISADETVRDISSASRFPGTRINHEKEQSAKIFMDCSSQLLQALDEVEEEKKDQE